MASEEIKQRLLRLQSSSLSQTLSTGLENPQNCSKAIQWLQSLRKHQHTWQSPACRQPPGPTVSAPKLLKSDFQYLKLCQSFNYWNQNKQIQTSSFNSKTLYENQIIKNPTISAAQLRSTSEKWELRTWKSSWISTALQDWVKDCSTSSSLLLLVVNRVDY